MNSNQANGTASDSIQPLTQSVVDKVVLTIAALIILVGLLANSIVISLTKSYKILKGRLGIYIINQATCNILLSAVPTLAYLIEKASGYWPFGGVACNAVVVIEYAVLTTSNAFLVIKCVEQYIAISKPLNIRRKKSRRIPILIGWLLGLCLAIPFVFLESRYIKRNGRNICNDLWAFIPKKGCGPSHAYFIVVFALVYVIPAIAMVSLYTRMIYILLQKVERPGVMTRSTKLREKRRKLNTVKMLVTNMVLFQVCWLPSYIEEFLMMFGHTNANEYSIRIVNVCLSLLGYAYAATCPLVYFTFMKKYRNAFASSIDKFKSAVRCKAKGEANDETKIGTNQDNIGMTVISDAK